MKPLSLKLHSVLCFIFLFMTLLQILLSKSWLLLFISFLIAVVFLFVNGLEFKTFLKIQIQFLLFSFFYLIMFYFFSKKFVLDDSLFIVSRLWLVSVVSVGSFYVIDLESLILYLCQKKIMSVRFAYPLLLALNSIYLFKKQIELIQMNARLRQFKGWILPHILFQFIVFTLRFSEAGALSVYSRQLNPDKLFYFQQELKLSEIFVFLLFLLLLLFALIASR